MPEWFKHDLKSRTHPRLQTILMRYGLEGVGLYWCLIEMLYEQGGSLMLSQCDCYAFALRTHPESLLSFIKESGAFEVQGDKFFSATVNDRMSERDQRSAKARKSAKKRWSGCERNANAMRTHNRLDANALRQECEGNAIREEKIREEKKREETNFLINNNREGDSKGETRNTPTPEQPKAQPDPEGPKAPTAEQAPEPPPVAPDSAGQAALPFLGATEGPPTSDNRSGRVNGRPNKKTRQRAATGLESDTAVFLRFSEVPALASVIKEWLAYKAERNEKYKPTGLKQLLARIEKRVEELSAPEVIARMQRAMASNWAGWDFEDPSKPGKENSVGRLETFSERKARVEREMLLKLSFEEAGYEPAEAERLSKLQARPNITFEGELG